MASVAHEYQYSVQVKSRYDLLASDALNSVDPDLQLKQIQSRNYEHKSSHAAVKEKTAAKPADKASIKKVSESSHEVIRDNSGVVPQNQSRGRNDLKADHVDAGIDDVQNAQRSDSWEARGRGRGGFTRSRPGNSGHREFDRHSGSDKTGVKAVIKKDGHGTGNWGTIKDEIEIAMAPEVTIDEHLIDTPVDSKEETPAEPEAKTLTLKEYKDQKASKTKVQLSTKGVRKANDGKDVFSNMVISKQAKPAVAQVVDVLEEEEKEPDNKPVFFELRRGAAMSRGRPSGRGDAHVDRPNHDAQAEWSPTHRGGRGSERGAGRGGRGTLNHERGGRGNSEHAGRGGFNSERGGRGGFNSERGGRGGFNSERGGRGGFNSERGGRGGFNPEHGRGGREGFDSDQIGRSGVRGRGRGGFSSGRGRGAYNSEQGGRVSEHTEGTPEIVHETGGGRGRGSGCERGRVAGFSDRGASRGGSRGSFDERPRGGRGRGQSSAGGFRGRGGFEQQAPVTHIPPAPPAMDSELDFPVLK